MEHSSEDFGTTYEPFEARPTRSRTIIAILGGIALAGVAVAWLTGAAWSHDALPTAAQPEGWSYPLACCSGYDCREVPKEAVEERPEGYVIKATGEVIPMTSRKVRPSPDGKFHWCSVGGKPDGKTICLFAPFGAS